MLEGLDAEIRDHIERETREFLERGMSPAEARAAALRKFGNPLRVAEDTRAVWNPAWVQQLWQDVQYGARLLRRNPGFAAVVALTLALGIGLNTAVYSVVNAVLVRPLAYPHPDRLAWLADYNAVFKAEIVAGPDFFDWRDQAKSFEKMVAYGYMDSTLAADGEAQQYRTAQVTDGFWEVSGARPALGHLFAPTERNALVIADSLFERRFRRNPGVIGKAVRLDGRPMTISGVLPKGFRFLFPQQMVALEPREMEIYVPNQVTRESQVRGRNQLVLNVVGKLKPNVPIAAARTELETIQARIARENPHSFYHLMTLRVVPLRDKLVGDARRPLLVLLAAVGFVLLIACANIANLLLARAATRRREIAIRMSVGAGRARVIRQFLGEALVLAAIGGAVGLLFARAAVAAMVRLAPHAVPRLSETNLDGSVLAYNLLVSLATALAFGFSPAVAIWRSSLHEVLKDSSRTFSAAPGRWFRRSLVVAEMAFAIVLLTGAGLMVKSFLHMNAHPPGFVPEQVLTLKVALAGPGYRTLGQQQAYVREALHRVETAPGVQAAGIINTPVRGVVQVEGMRPLPPDQAPQCIFNTVSASSGRALGMRLLRGRWLTDHESSDVVMINESLANLVFGGTDPIGKRLQVPGRQPPPMAVVVGLASDLKYTRLDARPEPEVYIPYLQSPFLRLMTVMVRASGDASSMAPAMRKLMAGVDPTQPVYEVKTLEQALADSILPRRFNLFLLGIFAAAALVLALVGIYGVVAYSVTQRTHEIGVRMALGAQRAEVVRLVVRQAMAIALAGIAAGLAAALGLTRLMGSLLYDVKATDAPTFAAVAAVLLVTALAASSVPAMRAARVEPVTALRYDG